MSILRSLKARLRRFRDDERGSVAVETLMMVPFLSWAMLSTLTYFHAYRAEAISQKAGLTIADMYSREGGYVTPLYLNGTRDLLQFLTLVDTTPAFRVTVVTWDDTSKKYERVWSRNRGAGSNLTDSLVNALAYKLPILKDGEQVILIETWTDYTAPYGVGLSDFTMDTFHVISPRFTDRLCWNPDENDPDDLDNDAICA